MRHPLQNETVGLGQIKKGDVILAHEPDLVAWIDALRLLPAAPVTEGDVLAWVEGPLRQFFPFERFLGAYGCLSGGRIHMQSSVSSGQPPERLACLKSKFDLKSRGSFAWWVINRRPFIVDRATGVFDEAGTPISPTKIELEEVDRFSVSIYAAHGVIDPFVNAGTYISFAGVPRDQPKRTLAALELIAPVLHTLYLRTKRADKSKIDLMSLTDRQRDLVDLAVMGLPDKAIASRLAISDHTVGNHFRAIFAKLGISKRSQLSALLK